ncbi:MAG: FmdE family protein [Methanobacterium sp.]|jgi:formylmethanofuran dehydrogenase subunit E|nr:FmdE family protein [Methanobacterium sp.]
MDEILSKIDDPKILSQIEKIIPFHGYLSTGAFIGIQMLTIAQRLLDIKEDDKVYVTCETFNCLPDPFQILCGCTVGNKGLKILDYGKMAMTINKAAKPGDKMVQGLRIILDPAKTADYPILHAWYMNERKISHEDAISELIKAGDAVYTWEYVDLPVPVKLKKKVAICRKCGESFVIIDDEDFCRTCF